MKRILVCGGRTYGKLPDDLGLLSPADAAAEHRRVEAEVATVARALSAIEAKHGPFEIIHGGAPGADELAGRWGKARGFKVTAVVAEWAREGRAAGPLRNQRMIDMKPDACVAFPGNRGTADMIARAERAGIPVWRI